MAVLIALILVVAAVVLWLMSSRARRETGLPQGRVIYSDTGAWQRNDRALFSRALMLTGKPDYLVRDGDEVIPVEVKSGKAPPTPREGHILQLAAYCALVEDNLGARPSHGIIQYDDRQFAVDYTPALEAELGRALDIMRAALADEDGAHRDHADARRCAACGVREACDERLG